MTNIQHADNFVGRYTSQYIDEDRQFGSQCWDLVARYAREEYGCPSFPTVSGGAEGLWRFFADPIPQYFDKVSRDALQPGDVAVWDASFYPPFGHTALVWQRDSGTIFAFEQDGSKDSNRDGNADGVAYVAHRTITNQLAGGLRPKNNYKGGDMPLTEDQFYELWRGITGREPTQAEANNTDYRNNPGLAIDTAWRNGGSQRYGGVISEDALYMLIRGIARREPTLKEAQNTDYRKDPDLAIKTFWRNGGEQLYKK